MSNNSQEVIEFMILFMQLREFCDDQPDELPQMAATDDSVKALCTKLNLSASELYSAERKHKVRFAVPVEPNFAEAWRDYENRYSHIVSDIFWGNALSLFCLLPDQRSSKADFTWENAEYDAKVASADVEYLIDWVEEQVEHNDGLPVGFAEDLLNGLETIEKLGKDSEGLFVSELRRRDILPFTFIPRHIAKHYGSGDRLSLYKHLEQAQEAFVCGAPLAALALMRSIMETLLRDHYEAKDGTLDEKINRCERLLPRGASVAALHRLRKISNAVVHFNADARALNFDFNDTKRVEQEIVSLLVVLRALIEGAPKG